MCGVYRSGGVLRRRLIAANRVGLSSIFTFTLSMVSEDSKLAHKGLNKDLHPSMKTKDEVKG
jgi:hypothetical protein